MATARAPLNLSWVTPQLAVGGSYPVEAAEHLARALGITHVVDVRGEACDDVRALREVGIELLHLPTADTRAIALERLDALRKDKAARRPIPTACAGRSSRRASSRRGFRKPDRKRLRGAMRTPVVFNGRNVFDPVATRAQGQIAAPRAAMTPA